MFGNSSFVSCIAKINTLLVLGSIAYATGGCSRFTRTKQCRALIAQVNPALDDVVAITHTGGAENGSAGSLAGGNGGSGGSGGASGGGGTGGGAGGNSSSSNGYVAAAGRYERLAKQLGPMEFGSEEMAKMVAEYAGVLNSAAENLRSLAAALDANNNVEAERLNRELERISVHERSLVTRMDAWCAP
ncbi:MAG TPA: hypothetical protein VER96_31990 [Polyangiaceae bacterium]|nr:hypothetical protein [Polyangiaceae bacterium]